MSDGKPTLGPNGLPLLRPATAPATPPAPATPTAPAAPSPRLDPLDVLRHAPRRRATRQQIEALAQRWGKR